MQERIYAPTGEKHGLINKLANSVQERGYDHFNAKIKDKVKKEREDDAKLVKARYINYRGKNERLTKNYCRYAGDPIEIYHLIPNEEYELPKGFIKEVNEHKGMAKRSDLLDKNGVPLKMDGYIKEHELVPCSF